MTINRMMAAGVASCVLFGLGCGKDDPPAKHTGEPGEKVSEASGVAKARAPSGAKPAVASPKAEVKANARAPKLPCDDASPKEVGDDGRLLFCTITADAVVGDYTCQKNSRVYLYDDGTLKGCYIKAARTIDGVPCEAANDTAFYASGKLKKCAVDRKSFSISGVSCRYYIELHDGGGLKRCQIASAAKLDGISAAAESWVTLYPSGKAQRIEHAEGHPLRFKKHTCVETYHYENGAVKMCALGEKMKYKGKVLPVNTHLCFDENGGKADDIDALCMKW